MTEVERVVFDAINKKAFMTPAQFEVAKQSLNIRGHYVDDRLVMAEIHNGPEFHFVLTDTRWHITKSDVRRVLAPIIAEFGYATTKTPKEDRRQQRFNERLGWFKTGEDEFDYHYRIEELEI